MSVHRSFYWPVALASLFIAACAPSPVSPDALAADGPPPASGSADQVTSPPGERPISHRSGPALPPPPSAPRPTDGRSDPTDAVSVLPGDADFHGGDGIELIEVRGTAPRLQVGSLYEVRGRYRLRSRAHATLLLSVTTSGPGGQGLVDSDSRQALVQGEGEFRLRVRVADEGHPHVTFYDEQGTPFGGLYFGHDAWRLEHKGWRYQATNTAAP
ncbi:MAG: hypothetical protein EOO70_00615 [Myxococcaceae bacterium]|nr:MAG: hypothetical protein EOO70_00615 [Myxococcaceae bacterium]